MRSAAREWPKKQTCRGAVKSQAGGHQNGKEARPGQRRAGVRQARCALGNEQQTPLRQRPHAARPARRGGAQNEATGSPVCAARLCPSGAGASGASGGGPHLSAARRAVDAQLHANGEGRRGRVSGRQRSDACPRPRWSRQGGRGGFRRGGGRGKSCDAEGVRSGRARVAPCPCAAQPCPTARHRASSRSRPAALRSSPLCGNEGDGGAPQRHCGPGPCGKGMRCGVRRQHAAWEGPTPKPTGSVRAWAPALGALPRNAAPRPRLGLSKVGKRECAPCCMTRQRGRARRGARSRTWLRHTAPSAGEPGQRANGAAFVG